MSKRPRKLPVKLADQKQVFILNVVNQATDVTSRSVYSGGGRAHLRAHLASSAASEG